MKTRHLVALSITVVITIFGLFYVLFDRYVASVATETVTTWIKGEENSIIEGNLLSSITKTQKILLSSDFIKGLAVYDWTDVEHRQLIEFGERIDLKNIELKQDKVIATGFLKKQIYLGVPNSDSLKIVLSVYSEKINQLFWVTSLIFSLIAGLFSFVVLLLKKQEQKNIEMYASKAKQAAHDLAQPIVVLNALSLNLQSMSHQTLLSVIQRINSIVNDLTDKKEIVKLDSGVVRKKTLSQKLSDLIQEKKILSNGTIDIRFQNIAETDSLKIDEDQLLRATSNLIQNSIEAGSTAIALSVSKVPVGLQFSISDNGHGITEEFKSRIGQKGLTQGKEFGSGLGLYGVCQFVKENKGLVEIRSEVGQGLEFLFSIPFEDQKKIILSSDTQVVVLDDEDICLRAWKIKLGFLAFDKPPLFFNSADELALTLKNFDRNELFLFSDYNLKSKISGLDFIEQNNLQGQSALVTGQSSDKDIISRANKSKVNVYSKSDLNEICIELL